MVAKKAPARRVPASPARRTRAPPKRRGKRGLEALDGVQQNTPNNHNPVKPTADLDPDIWAKPPTGSSPGPSDKLDAGAIDWVKAGKVAPVQDQGNCNGCWAWAAACAIESAVAVKTGGPVIKLSEQMLLECTDANVSNGCNGGDHVAAIGWVGKHGLATALEYPSRKPGICRRETAVGPKIIGVFATQNDVDASEVKMLQFLRTRGPLSVSVFTNEIWQHYAGGVIRAGDCNGAVKPDHGVAIVGAGTFKGLPVWIIRNSWGTRWGYNGYAFLERGTNACMVCRRIGGAGI